MTAAGRVDGHGAVRLQREAADGGAVFPAPQLLRTGV